jgi:hypothetical protein
MPPAVAGGANAYHTVEDTVGNTPLVRLQRLGRQQLAARNNVVLCKLEGASRAGALRARLSCLLRVAPRPGARRVLTRGFSHCDQCAQATIRLAA